MGSTRSYHNSREQEQLIDEWQKSQMSAKNFCDNHQIKLSTFHNWQARVNKLKTRPPKTAKLIPIEATDASPTTTGRYMIHFPSGIRLELMSLADTVRLIKQLHQEDIVCR